MLIKSSAFLILMDKPTAFGSSKFSPIMESTRSCHILPKILTPLSRFFLILRIQNPPLGNDSHIGTMCGPSLKRYRLTLESSCDGRFKWQYSFQKPSTVSNAPILCRRLRYSTVVDPEAVLNAEGFVRLSYQKHQPEFNGWSPAKRGTRTLSDNYLYIYTHTIYI